MPTRSACTCDHGRRTPAWHRHRCRLRRPAPAIRRTARRSGGTHPRHRGSTRRARRRWRTRDAAASGANDHSPSTETSTVPGASVAVARHRLCPHGFERGPPRAHRLHVAARQRGPLGMAPVELGFDERATSIPFTRMPSMSPSMSAPCRSGRIRMPRGCSAGTRRRADRHRRTRHPSARRSQ